MSDRCVKLYLPHGTRLRTDCWREIGKRFFFLDPCGKIRSHRLRSLAVFLVYNQFVSSNATYFSIARLHVFSTLRGPSYHQHFVPASQNAFSYHLTDILILQYPTDNNSYIWKSINTGERFHAFQVYFIFMQGKNLLLTLRRNVIVTGLINIEKYRVLFSMCFDTSNEIGDC